MLSSSELISGFVVNYVINATWQITVIAIIAALGSLLLRHGPARYRHVLWLTALTLCVVVPFLTTTPNSTATPISTVTLNSTATQPHPANQSRSDRPTAISTTPLGRVSPEPQNPVSNLTKRRTQVVSTTSQTALWLTLIYTLFIAWRGIRFVRFWRSKDKLARCTELTDLSSQAEGVARCRHPL